MNDFDKDDQDWIKNNVPESEIEAQSNLPEAPASVTIRGYFKGYSVLITNRDPKVNVAPLLAKAMNGITWMIENGFKPSWNNETNSKSSSTPKIEVKTKPCEQCGGTRKLVEGVSKGKRWAGWFCQNEVSHCPVEWIPLNKK